MKRFAYLAARSDGVTVRGYLHARMEADIDRRLLSMGIQPVRVTETVPSAGAQRRPARHHLALLLRSIASLCQAGVPVLAALEACEKLTLPSLVRSGVADAQALVREGESLASALEHTGLLPAATTAALRAGERGGQLQTALQRAATQLEYEAAAVARLKRALSYPLILLTAGCVSSAVIVFVILPRFTALLDDAGLPIPLVARGALGVAAMVQQYWLLTLLAAAVVVLGLRRWTAVPHLTARLHRALLAAPFVGRLRLAWATTQVSSSLATMLETGLPLLRALEIATDGIRDEAVRERLVRTSARIANGAGLSASLSAESAFLPGTLVLVALGEASGRVPEMLLRAGESARAEAERSLETALTLLEPGLIVAFAGVVALLAAAMFQSIYGLRPGG
ncbi:MAG: type II secretion system F family protein [Gemmatimonadales bacterium]